MKNKIILLVASGFFAGLMVAPFLSSDAAAEQPKVIAIDIPGLHEAGGSGWYDKVYAKAGIKLTLLPAARAFIEFDACPNCCITPANKNPEFYTYTTASYIESKPINVAKIYIWSAPGKPVETNLKALVGKKVAARIGFPYGRSVENSGVKLDLVPNLEQNVKRLELGRIDYMIDYTPDTLNELKTLGHPETYLPYAPEAPVAVHNDAMLCKSAPETIKLIETFDASF